MAIIFKKAEPKQEKLAVGNVYQCSILKNTYYVITGLFHVGDILNVSILWHNGKAQSMLIQDYKNRNMHENTLVATNATITVNWE